MTGETKLAMLKIDLGIRTTAYDERLTEYLNGAAREILREGYTLKDGKSDDDNLQINYAAWMWRRRDTGEGMPRMIRWQLNNRLFDMSTGGESDG